ncbi:hypothetical protein EYC84_004602 [Monilinia fructicola]|uniref:Uncharacterized protein n=1 Tax=Monilinia fructicola TaxID=38448 RepID=A0A5M9K3V6_MONFR|nr:hypothetical protein EYC84_004602 [Monilinia fructicola]
MVWPFKFSNPSPPWSTYVADQWRNFNTILSILTNNCGARSLYPSFTLIHDMFLTEFILTFDFHGSKFVELQHWENVENELLEFDAIRLFGFDGCALLGIYIRDLSFAQRGEVICEPTRGSTPKIGRSSSD